MTIGKFLNTSAIGIYGVFASIYYYYHPYCLLVGLIIVSTIAAVAGVFILVRRLREHRRMTQTNFMMLLYRSSPARSLPWAIDAKQQYIPRSASGALNLQEWQRPPTIRQHNAHPITSDNLVSVVANSPTIEPQSRKGLTAAASSGKRRWIALRLSRIHRRWTQIRAGGKGAFHSRIAS